MVPTIDLLGHSCFDRIQQTNASMLNIIGEAHLQKRASHTETWAATEGKGLFGSMNRVMNELNDI